MNQLDRRKEDYGAVIKKGLEVRNAVSVLNACLIGRVSAEGMPDIEPPTLQQERVAIVIFNKFVPSLAAIQLQVEDNRPKSVHDLNTMLVLNGLPALPDTTAIEHAQENAIVSEKVAEAGTPAIEDE